MISTSICYKRGSLILLCLIIYLFVLAAAASAQTLEQKLGQYLEAAFEVDNFYGAALVAKDGRVIFEDGYGFANIELGVPNTPETIFLIGSITKQFTATAIMQLYEQGLIDLNDSITKYLTDYPSETGDKITIHHLLTHTAGIYNYTRIGDLMEKKALAISVEDILAAFKDLPLDFEPGSQFSYSNSGYVVLGAIIEKVTGMTYAEYLQKNIMDPLGMKNSGYVQRSKILKNRAAGYYLDDEDNFVNADFVHMSMPYSAGAIHSTVGDMLIWDQALYTDKILKHSSLEKMFTPFLENYAYGWTVREKFGHKLIRHGGGIDGFVTTFCRYVDEKVCIVVFSNNISCNTDGIADGLAAIMFDLPYDLPMIKTPIEINPEILSEYAGVYKIKADNYRVISLEEGKLYSCRNSGRRIEIFPEAEDKFFFDHDHAVTLKFVRDEKGRVIRHIIHQGGEDAPAEKIEGDEAEKLLAASKSIELDPAVLEKYVGEYELGPGFILRVQVRDNHLQIQAMDNPELKLMPFSETVFKNQENGVEVTFLLDSTGQTESVELMAGGREMAGKKIK